MTAPMQLGLDFSAALQARDRVLQQVNDSRDTAAICRLVASDPMNQPSVDAVITAVRQLAGVGEISRNDVTPLLPPWVAPKVIGSTFNRLRALHVLQATGRHVWSTDRRGRNGNKLCPTYVVHLDRLPS